MNKFPTTCVAILFGILLSSVGCEDADNTIYHPQSTINVPDTTIYLASLPFDVELKLGHSVRILNAGTIFLFHSVLEDTRHVVLGEPTGNVKILMLVDYGSMQKYIELNSVDVPGQYLLENGLKYVISLKQVTGTDSTCHILFQFSSYKDR